MVGPAHDTGQSISLPRRTSPDLAAGLAPTPNESNDLLIEHDRAGSQPRVGSGGGDQQSTCGASSARRCRRLVVVFASSLTNPIRQSPDQQRLRRPGAAGRSIPPARNWSSVTGWLPALRSRSSIRSCWVSASAIDRIPRPILPGASRSGVAIDGRRSTRSAIGRELALTATPPVAVNGVGPEDPPARMRPPTSRRTPRKGR
jgi:hypothetical protein